VPATNPSPMPSIAVAAALAAVLLAAVAVVAFRRGARSDRRFDDVLGLLDDRLQPVSEALEQAASRADEVRSSGDVDRELGATLERLLDEIAAEGAPAHAFRRVAERITPALADRRRLPKAKRPPGRDDLTGVRDRDGYEAELEREIARARRGERPLALAILDLGDLSEARVRAGHAEVDRLLQDFAELLVRVTRTTDTVCRRRGEEFGILLPETTATGARHVRRRVREEASRRSFGRLGPVTFSTGIVEWQPEETAESLDARARAATVHASVRALGARGADENESLRAPDAG
jgi:diguanylate cyclase (GGDEF)-like protein